MSSHYTDLYIRARQGDQMAQQELADELLPKLKKFAALLLWNHGENKNSRDSEIANTSWVKLFEANTFDPKKGDFEQYAFGTVRNVTRSYLRSLKKFPNANDESDSEREDSGLIPFDEIFNEQDSAKKIVARLMKDAKLEDVKVFEVMMVHDCDMMKAANGMGIKYLTFRRRWYRAIDRAKKILSEFSNNTQY